MDHGLKNYQEIHPTLENGHCKQGGGSREVTRKIVLKYFDGSAYGQRNSLLGYAEAPLMKVRFSGKRHFRKKRPYSGKKYAIAEKDAKAGKKDAIEGKQIF